MRTMLRATITSKPVTAPTMRRRHATGYDNVMAEQSAATSLPLQLSLTTSAGFGVAPYQKISDV